ncbi:MAG: hypothetical protein ACXACA_04885 [Candidatus Ranarchaeia archaeon]|jgi:hypothetical protein
MTEEKIHFSKQGLVALLETERSWVRKVFPEGKLTQETVVWNVPDTPYDIEWLLWHISESHHWVRVAVLEMRKRDGEPIGYPKFEAGSSTGEERIEAFLAESKKFQKKVEEMSEKELNENITHLSMFGEQTVPLAQVVVEDIMHVIGHLNVISFIKGLKGRKEGEKQKWPPY